MTAKVVAAVLALSMVSVGATPPVASSRLDTHASRHGSRHHYSISARVRPLLFFWIKSDDVGDAVIRRRQEADAAGYSLLIGSDPERAPRRINRWGYIDEQIRGNTATLVGLMTESDEESIEQAEASIGRREGERTFNIIRATVGNDEARSIVTSVTAPSTYSYRQIDALLDLAEQEPARSGKARVVHLPAGTRPGFLAAVADLLRAQVEQWRTSGRAERGTPVSYVYHGHLYQLGITSTQPLLSARIGNATYDHVISSRFQIVNAKDNERTDFEMTYAADGPLAEVPLAASYRPRWWLEIQLTLDDSASGPLLAREVQP